MVVIGVVKTINKNMNGLKMRTSLDVRCVITNSNSVWLTKQQAELFGQKVALSRKMKRGGERVATGSI